MNLFLILGAVVLLLVLASVCAWLACRKRTEIRNMVNAANPPNAGRNINGLKTMLADGAISRYNLVKFGSDEDHVAVSAGATDKILGIALDQADNAEDPITIAILGACYGTQLVVATGVILVDALVQSNGDGTVKTAVSTGLVIGKALQASGATGDVIEIAPFYSGVALA